MAIDYLLISPIILQHHQGSGLHTSLNDAEFRIFMEPG